MRPGLGTEKRKFITYSFLKHLLRADPTNT